MKDTQSEYRYNNKNEDEDDEFYIPLPDIIRKPRQRTEFY